MSAPSKIHNVQLVKIQPEEMLATTSELNPAPSLVTGFGESRGMGYWAATQVKGLGPEIHVVSLADVFHMTEGSTPYTVDWQGDESPTGSETVARCQMDVVGTREAQCVLLNGVCTIKPMNGKIIQTTLWESDQFIVPKKQGCHIGRCQIGRNACEGKGLAEVRCDGRDTPPYSEMDKVCQQN